MEASLTPRTRRPRPQVVSLTEAAAARVREIMDKADQTYAGLRVGVKNGGCAGQEYVLEYAAAAASVPNGVTDELFDRMKLHWSEDQIVEITGIISVFGFLNRFNDSMATPLEPQAIGDATRVLGKGRWSPGKHSAPSSE